MTKKMKPNQSKLIDSVSLIDLNEHLRAFSVVSESISADGFIRGGITFDNMSHEIEEVRKYENLKSDVRSNQEKAIEMRMTSFKS